jgi:hypothetical protein
MTRGRGAHGKVPGGVFSFQFSVFSFQFSVFSFQFFWESLWGMWRIVGVHFGLMRVSVFHCKFLSALSYITYKLPQTPQI